ncbi:bifunctional diaminohydroxyphosphoribosylaminopyrimidine deaminase/5-amino-6-(5-phosphoribosylamino)uracil reductase, partial [Shewanella algae]
CNHHGRTPPCSDSIIKADIKRVVVGTHDLNPKVKGGGLEKLQTAGIEVISGVAENECRHLFHAFAHHARTDRVWLTIKRAINSEGL